MPLVSVLMSVHNGQRYLKDAIVSILHQTFTDYEFLIINDGSTDNSKNIIESFNDSRIRLVDNPRNVGLVKSLNRGLQLARGELIARQDADDISHLTRLEQQVRFLNAQPKIALIGTQARLIDQKGDVIPTVKYSKPLTGISIQWHLMFDNVFIHTSVMFRRKVVYDQFQGYDERAITCEDFELWSRVADKYPVRNLPQTLVDYRVQPESIMAKNRDLNLRMNERIILSNLRRFLRSREIPKEWASLIGSLRTSPRLGRINEPSHQLVKVIDTMFYMFCKLHPEVVVDQDIRRHIAEQLGIIAYNSVTCNRLTSIKAITRACHFDVGIIKRGIAGQIPFLKYFVLCLGGEFGRHVYRRFVSR